MLWLTFINHGDEMSKYEKSNVAETREWSEVRITNGRIMAKWNGKSSGYFDDRMCSAAGSVL